MVFEEIFQIKDFLRDLRWAVVVFLCQLGDICHAHAGFNKTLDNVLVRFNFPGKLKDLVKTNLTDSYLLRPAGTGQFILEPCIIRIIDACHDVPGLHLRKHIHDTVKRISNTVYVIMQG